MTKRTATRRAVQGELFAGGIDPDVTKAEALVATLSGGFSTSAEVFETFAELDALPPALAQAALAAATGPAPDPDRLDAAVRIAHGFPPPALKLVTTAIVKDADVLDLGPLAVAQVRAAGRSWDGVDLEAEERLDGEREDTFAGTLEYRRLVDASSHAPVVEVILYLGDSGAVFKAGTSDLVGAIAYGKVEMADRRSRLAIQDALADTTIVKARPVRADVAPDSESVPTRKLPALELPKKKTAAKVKKTVQVELEAEPTTVRTTKKKAASKKKTAATKKTAAAPKKAATKKVTASKKAATKKVAAAPKKAAAAPKKAVPAKKKAAAAPKKAAKKAATRKAAPTKKKAAAPKKATKKAAAKKKS